MTTPRTQRLALHDVDGDVEIEVEEHGEGDACFVLVHGFTGSRNDWLEQLPVLARAGRTIAYDHRGHGGSTNVGNPEGYSFDILARDLARVADALGLDRFDLLGHSMGGCVALRFALAAPERVRSLILMDTGARPFPFFPKPVFEKIVELGRASGMQAMVPAMRANADAPTRAASAKRCEAEMGSERFWARIETKHSQMDPEAFARLGQEITDQADLSARLAEIACPTTVIVGLEDQALLAYSDELAAGIPGAELVRIPDAAHSPQLENPEAWRRAVLGHLARARASG